MKRLLKCLTCKTYTLKEIHVCGGKTVSPGPAKWSPEDKYGKYRREAKREEFVKRGFV